MKPELTNSTLTINAGLVAAASDSPPSVLPPLLPPPLPPSLLPWTLQNSRSDGLKRKEDNRG